MAELDKGYKFRIEYEMPNEPVDGILRSMTRITTFGITAKEVIDAHSEIMDEWEKFLDKQVKKPYRNRENLK